MGTHSQSGHTGEMKGLWLLLVLVAAAKAERIFIGDQVIRVHVQSEEQIQLLQALETEEEWELDFWLHPVNTELPVDIRVPRSSLSAVKDYLNVHNVPFSVMINNLQEHLDEERAEIEEPDKGAQHQELQLWSLSSSGDNLQLDGHPGGSVPQTGHKRGNRQNL